MSTKQVLGFSELYSGMWRVFKSCYGPVLGWGILYVAIAGMLSQIISQLGLPGKVAFAVLYLAGVVVMVPVAAYLKYDVLRRTRQKASGTTGSPPERAKSKMYGNLVLIGLFGALIVLPSNILFIAGLPTEIKNLELATLSRNPAAIKKLVQDITQTYQAEEKDEKAEPGPKPKNADQEALSGTLAHLLLPTRGQVILLSLGGVLAVVASLVMLTWIPWAWLALLDPRTDVTTAGAALRYARELTAGTCSGAVRWSIFGVSLVAGLIMFGSLFLCCVGVYFLGIPLVFAFGPGLYLVMRGE